MRTPGGINIQVGSILDVSERNFVLPKIVAWNIQSGGGNRIRDIVKQISKHDADIVVLSEFRNNRRGDILHQRLESAGFHYQIYDKKRSNINTVLVGSRNPIKKHCIFPRLGEHQHRLIEVQFLDFTMIAFYFPQKKEKIPVFEQLLELAQTHGNQPVILIGDLNTGKHLIDEEKKTFVVPHYIDQIENLGWTDAWRHNHGDSREYSWYSYAGNGFRIDHAFVSPSMLKELKKTSYSHEERINRISDHSLLIVEFGNGSVELVST